MVYYQHPKDQVTNLSKHHHKIIYELTILSRSKTPDIGKNSTDPIALILRLTKIILIKHIKPHKNISQTYFNPYN